MIFTFLQIVPSASMRTKMWCCHVRWMSKNAGNCIPWTGSKAMIGLLQCCSAIAMSRVWMMNLKTGESSRKYVSACWKDNNLLNLITIINYYIFCGACRVTVEQNPYRLVIKDLRISDEDIYLCDTTFFIPEETCDNFNGYRVELRVLGKLPPEPRASCFCMLPSSAQLNNSLNNSFDLRILMDSSVKV